MHHHLRKARKIALESKASIYQQHQGIKSKTCAGGLFFSLDLEGAFDSVPRTQLAASMRRLHIPEDLIHMAMEFYRHARYFSSIGSHEDSVVSTCGIKQGCTLAPYLFVIHTVTTIEEIGKSLGIEWMRTMLTFFADDSIGTWEVHNIADLKKAFAGIETITTLFNDYGMKLSNDKCVILYDLQGREAHKFLSKRKHRRNKTPRFKFHQMGEDLWVPSKKYHEYLGTIIAYRDAPARTCAHRMKKARGQYSQLRKTINSARIVSNRPRYQVWRSGVLSSATYGLLATGATYTSKRSLQAMTARQTRAIARRPAHLTHVTNEQIKEILRAEDPFVTLTRQGDDLLGKLNRIAREHPQDIRGQDQAREQLQYVLTTLRQEERANTSPTRPEEEAAEYKCQRCEKSYTSMTSLKKHMAISHKIKFQGGIKFDAAKHAMGNLPQGAYCGHKFGEWYGLRMHIERVNCPKLMLGQMQANLMTTGDAPVVHQAQHFAQHCCLCNRWVRDPNAVKRHLSQAHVEQWKQVASRLEARCAEIKHLLDRDGICPWCTRVSYSRHFKQCNIVFQCALLGLLHEDGRGGRVGVRRLAAGSVSPTERVNEEAQGTRTARWAAEQAAPASKARPARQRTADSAGQPQQRCLDLGGSLPSTGRCAQRSQTRQLAHVPSRTNRTRGNSQVTLRSWTMVAREEGPGGAAAGPQNGSVRTAGHGDQGQVNPLRPGPQRSQGSGGTPALSRIGDALQGQHHHQIQLGAQDEEGTRGEREGRVRRRNRSEVPGGTSSTGVADSASQLHSVEPCGSANAPTIPEETQSGGSPPKGPGGRVGGSNSGANRDRRPALQGLPRDLTRMKMRNNSNTCKLKARLKSSFIVAT